MNNSIYQYRLPYSDLKLIISTDDNFYAIIEKLDMVSYKNKFTIPVPSVPDEFKNDFVQARLFNCNYDINVRKDSGEGIEVVILTEKKLGYADSTEYTIIHCSEMTHNIKREDRKRDKARVIKYICKPLDSIRTVNDSVSFINEKQIFYRIIGVSENE